MKGFNPVLAELCLPMAAILALAGTAAGGAEMLLGFADDAGRRIIAAGSEIHDASEPMWVVLPSGETREVIFLGRAEGTPENTYRDRASNFDELAGRVFDP
jgi:hypothetical protein